MRPFRVLPLLLGMALVPAASAQHHHAGGHDAYRTWASQKTDNCCNKQDCGALRDDEWRETVAGPEVRISGQWCPVRTEHFLVSGKSPDWSRAHACIQPDVKYSTGRKTPCERLLCFAGTPKF
jgi:hypothetical protein